MGKARTLSSLVSTNALLSDGQISASEIVGQVETLRIGSISYPGDDLAADPNGGQTITVVGAGFAATPTVYVGGTIASSVTFVSTTQITFVAPARPAGTYDVYVVNPSGATAIRVFGISYSGVPAWTTAAGSLGTVEGTFSVQLQATSNSAITYALASGSTLPSGVTLSSSGLLSGSVATDQTFSFTAVAIDAENQDTSRSFQVTVNLVDPFFDNNVLLLAGNGTNLAQNNTFVDSSTNNFSLARNGNVSQGTFTPYGTNWSNYFESGSSRLTAANTANWQFGTGDFTIEAFVFLDSISGYQVFAKCSDDGTWNAGWTLHIQSGRLQLWTNSGLAITGETLAAGTWNHVAATRSGTTLRLFLNGIVVATVTNSENFAPTNALSIGGESGSANYPLRGYISNLRINKGTALYTSNFTPATVPLTAVSGTVLLTCQDNRFVDRTNSVLTIIGTPKIQRFGPFNPTVAYSAGTYGGSAYFDGSGDYLVKTGTDSLSGNFTIEYWMYPTSTGSYPTTFSNYPASPIGTLLLAQFNNTSSSFYFDIANGTSEVLVGQYTAVLNSWQHHAIVRSGSTITTYVNGVALASVTNSVNFPFSTLGIGGYTNGSYSFFGYIAGFRVVNGTAVYTANFTPPTTPPTAVANTSLLLNFTNAGIVDNAMQNNLETVGDAKISTVQSKFGNSSILFDGVGDFLKIPYNELYNIGNANYTVEAWIYPTQHGEIVGAFNLTGPNFAGWLFSTGFGVGGVGKLSTYFANTNEAQSNIFSTGNVSLNTWSHVAFTKQGTTVRLFINGNLDTTGTLNIVPSGSNQQIHIGADSNSLTAPSRNFGGYINDLRITKGIARYTSSFTPPTLAHKLK